MRQPTVSLIVLAIGFFAPAAFGYGSGGGGGSSCSEPQFSSESPKNETAVPTLSRFTFEASKNTDLKTLTLEVDGVKQEPKVSTLLSGDSKIELDLKEPKSSPAKVRITVRAKSDDGCEAFQPYYIEVKP